MARKIDTLLRLPKRRAKKYKSLSKRRRGIRHTESEYFAAAMRASNAEHDAVNSGGSTLDTRKRLYKKAALLHLAAARVAAHNQSRSLNHAVRRHLGQFKKHKQTSGMRGHGGYVY